MLRSGKEYAREPAADADDYKWRPRQEHESLAELRKRYRNFFSDSDHIDVFFASLPNSDIGDFAPRFVKKSSTANSLPASLTSQGSSGCTGGCCSTGRLPGN